MVITRRGNTDDKVIKEKHEEQSMKGKPNSKSTDDDDENNTEQHSKLFKYKLTRRKVLIRVVLCSAIIFMVYTKTINNNPKVFASQESKIQFKSHEVECSKDYQNELAKFQGCVPVRCGRVITDDIITPHESFELLRLAKKGLTLGGAFGGVSILDIHSGALSQGEQFINIYKLMKEKNIKDVFTHESFELYRSVKNKIQRMVALHFGLRAKNIYLTHPTFFSRMQNSPPRTIHDEYWHVHVDKETYGSFHYTSLLYLSDHDIDFKGGQFTFVDQSSNMTIEPKAGRILAFTSGSENAHKVEKVTEGVRFALTVSFTCNKKLAISSPTVAKLK